MEFPIRLIRKAHRGSRRSGSLPFRRHSLGRSISADLLLSFAAVLIMASGSCAKSVPPPLNAESAAIGVSVVERPPVEMFGDKSPGSVWFVKLDASGGLTDAHSVISAQYAQKGVFFLLNAEPGQYAMVFFSRDRASDPGQQVMLPGNFTNVIFLNEKDARGTIVEVTPGRVAYMGDLIVKSSAGWDHADRMQEYFYQNTRMQSGLQLISFLQGAAGTYLTGTTQELRRDDESKHAFFLRAKEAFAKSGWEGTIDRE